MYVHKTTITLFRDNYSNCTPQALQQGNPRLCRTVHVWLPNCHLHALPLPRVRRCQLGCSTFSLYPGMGQGVAVCPGGGCDAILCPTAGQVLCHIIPWQGALWPGVSHTALAGLGSVEGRGTTLCPSGRHGVPLAAAKRQQGKYVPLPTSLPCILLCVRDQIY